MRIHIQHATTYVYDRPVSFGRHRLVLRPREGHDLRIEQMHLRIEPAHHLMWIRDVFGNSVALVDYREPADVLTIVNDLVIQRVAPFPARQFHEPWRVPFPPSYDPLETAVTRVYQASAFPDDVPRVSEWVERTFTPQPLDAEGTMQWLCELIFRTIRYQRRMEKGVQTPSQTLELGSGSCRDMATLMMEAARCLGVAARFSSGYLHGSASMAGRGSTHAWTEVYLPTLGWRGFDPTSGKAVSLRHVVVGVSHHPRGVMPVSGAFTGAQGACKAMHVSVTSREPGEGAPDVSSALQPVAAEGQPTAAK